MGEFARKADGRRVFTAELDILSAFQIVSTKSGEAQHQQAKSNGF